MMFSTFRSLQSLLLACAAVDPTGMVALAAPQPVAAPVQVSWSAGGNSFSPSVSTNSRFIAFVSQANNLSTNDDLGAYLDVFVRDLDGNSASLVSVNKTGFGGGSDHSLSPSISGDGRFVAFESAASNLTPDDTNGLSDVFVRDLVAGTTTLVSVSTNGRSANGASGTPLISADGRWVFFESAASNLVSSDINGTADIFVRDLLNQNTVLVSSNAVAAGPNRGACHSASITPDGRFVAFVKAATNNVVGFPQTYADIYVRDMQLGVTIWASTNVVGGALGPPYQCSNPSISSNGRFVTFSAANPSSPVTERLLHFDLQSGETNVIHDALTSQSEPRLSADGRRVAFEARTGLYVWDAQSVTNYFIHTNSLTGLPQAPMSPAISSDGTRVAYVVTTNGTASLYVSDWQAGSNWIASIATNGSPATVSDTAAPVLSPDGRYLFFESHDSRIVANDWNRSSDIFRVDLANAATRLVSERHPDRPSLTGAAVSGVLPLAVSANGNTIGFWGLDGNFSGDDTNGYLDAFVRSNGAQHFLGRNVQTSGDAVFSANGRFAAFLTGSGPITWFPALGTVNWRDLVTGSNVVVTTSASRGGYMLLGIPLIAISSDGSLVAYRNQSDVIVHDVHSRSNRVASVDYTGTTTGNGTSTTLMFSPDDRWLYFSSTSNNLTTNGTPGLFARDLYSNFTIQINSQFAATGYRRVIAASANSRYVASQNSDWSLSLFDFITGIRSQICNTCWSPSLSADGRWMVFEQRNAAPFLPGRQIILRDLVAGTTNLVSTNSSTLSPANRDSTMPSISHDGRYVVFASLANNLVPGDNNNAEDVFVRDLRRNITILASINRTGTGPGNGPSLTPLLAADGRTVVFQSFASDLMERDFNETGDVFVLTLSGPDTDSDGLDDDWELAYFNTLSRDGSGDYDGDGASDRSEFKAGTDPANTASVLTVLTIAGGSGETRSILWSAIPGRSYQIQFKNGIGDLTWTTASAAVLTSGSTGSWTDPESASSPQRFYRVVLVP